MLKKKMLEVCITTTENSKGVKYKIKVKEKKK